VVLLWGIDFETHDIPHYLLAPSESYVACLSYFSSIKSLGYNLKLLVCDDNDAIKMAVRYVHPDASIQTCQNHFLESVRRDLNVRSSKTHQPFFLNIEAVLKQRLNPFSFNLKLAETYKEFNGIENRRVAYWISEMIRRKEELLAYQKFPDSPSTTNTIEAYNSHLEARLKALKGFGSFHSADLWINGYILRRRLKPFTDCGEYFKHLNGKSSLENVLKDNQKLPQIFT
jgi:transposase-like protein